MVIVKVSVINQTYINFIYMYICYFDVYINSSQRQERIAHNKLTFEEKLNKYQSIFDSFPCDFSYTSIVGILQLYYNLSVFESHVKIEDLPNLEYRKQRAISLFAIKIRIFPDILDEDIFKLLENDENFYKFYIEDIVKATYSRNPQHFDKTFMVVSYLSVFQQYSNTMLSYSTLLNEMNAIKELNTHYLLIASLLQQDGRRMVLHNNTQYNLNLEKAKLMLPPELRTILWEPVRLLYKYGGFSMKMGDYIQSERGKDYIARNVKMVTTRSLSNDDMSSRWYLESSSYNVSEYFIRNAEQPELYLYEKNYYHNNVVERDVFVGNRDKSDEFFNASTWQIQPMDENFTIFSIYNTGYKEYLYCGAQDWSYENRYTFRYKVYTIKSRISDKFKNWDIE